LSKPHAEERRASMSRLVDIGTADIQIGQGRPGWRVWNHAALTVWIFDEQA
jgi:hypothetical protein